MSRYQHMSQRRDITSVINVDGDAMGPHRHGSWHQGLTIKLEPSPFSRRAFLTCPTFVCFSSLFVPIFSVLPIFSNGRITTLEPSPFSCRAFLTCLTSVCFSSLFVSIFLVLPIFSNLLIQPLNFVFDSQISKPKISPPLFFINYMC